MKYDFAYKRKWKDIISEEEFNQLKNELRLELDDFENAEGLHEKRLHNLKLIKNGYFKIDDTLVNADWPGGEQNNPITKIRKENPEDFTKWKVGKTVVYESSEGREIAMLRPGKEAHRKYSTTGYIEKKGKKQRIEENEFDCLPVILEGKKVIARRVEYQKYDTAIRALKPKQALLDVLEESGLEYDSEKKTIKDIQEFLIEKEYKTPNPKVNRFTPWTLEHLAIGFEEIKLIDKHGDLALQIIGAILVRMAFMEGHKQDPQNELYKVHLPEKSIEVLNRILPDGVKINKGMESTSIDSILLLMDLLGLNEEVKVDWKGLLNLEEKGSPTPKGRVNTLLTYATFVSNAINQDNIQSKTVFQYQRSQNDPRDLQFYRDSFIFLGDSKKQEDRLTRMKRLL
jgi:hypothetical protein